ncbi:hypothetical protein TorRG33x02_053850 [Trema orientale]|uniref:Uncharacterized protein n=1 Tax=Trema orientale TaxID=63057 RepID=A0A2P5FLW3_TREOI|nr:hypothetical protein TorRG33x02_053850 [Trema orientale]
MGHPSLTSQAIKTISLIPTGLPTAKWQAKVIFIQASINFWDDSNIHILLGGIYSSKGTLPSPFR